MFNNITNVPPFVYQQMSVLETIEHWANAAAGINLTTPVTPLWTQLQPIDSRRKRLCKAGYLQKGLTPALALQTMNLLKTSAIPATFLFKSLGGKMAQNSGGVFMGRDAVALYEFCEQFTLESERAARSTALNAVWQQFVTISGSYGGVPSYLDDSPGWQNSTYGYTNWQNLIALKDKWDPMDVFHTRIGVRPTGVSD